MKLSKKENEVANKLLQMEEDIRTVFTGLMMLTNPLIGALVGMFWSFVFWTVVRFTYPQHFSFGGVVVMTIPVMFYVGYRKLKQIIRIRLFVDEELELRKRESTQES